MSFFGRSGQASPAHGYSDGSPKHGVDAVPAPSPSSASSVPRSYKDLFVHQYQHVSAQTDEGLRSVKRAASFFEHTCDVHLTSAESSLKQIKAVKEKYADSKDEATHYVNASMMVEEVMEHTGKTIETFAKSVINDLVKPMRGWHKSQVAKKEKLDKEMSKLSEKLKLNIEEINKERKACQAAFNELKAAATQKQAMEQQGQSNTDAYNKHKAKWAKLKEAATKKFQAFESKLDNCRTAQQNFYRIDVPARLTELEAIERERLAYQQECYTKFAAIFATYSQGLAQSNELMQKVLPTLNANKAMNLLFDKWSAQFGSAAQLMPVPYDLPCRWTEIQSDVLDSQGGQGAAAMNGAPAPLGSPAAAGSYHQPAPAPPANDYQYQQSAPPQHQYQPPAHHAVDDANPFAADAASASVGADAALFVAEALFDFDLPNEAGGEIQYVNFKAGDKISVLQEGDEWWFGEVHGQQGFFPANYSVRR